MSNGFQVEGKNAAAPFTLKIHRGDCMVLLAMNWRNGRPPRDFVGFALQYKEPGGRRYFTVKNRIAFPGVRTDPDQPNVPTLQAPIQKFRWVHFPRFADLEGNFTYRITPVFMNAVKELSYGEAQEAEVELKRETHPGKLNVAFTRGFVSSQAFVKRYAPDGKITSLVAPDGKKGLEFVPTHPEKVDAFQWMGLEAREAILKLLDAAIAGPAEVRVIAYDINLPEILTRLEALGPRLKIIIDDSTGDGGGHRAADSPESIAAARLAISAGQGNVRRQHLANLQHHKSIAVSAPGLHKVVYGSTNFTWRGFFVQSNNALIVSSERAVQDYFEVFDTYSSLSATKFRQSTAASKWHSLHLDGIDAAVAFSPHSAENGVLRDVADDIDAAESSVFFSLAFLGQTTKGPVGPAIGRVVGNPSIFALGIADARVGPKNLGVSVIDADGKRKIVRSSSLTRKVPKPFSAEPTGLAGEAGNKRGTRMHHKFLVLDFNTDKARVYLGSYNFSEPADGENGENLVVVRDRRVATSYMIEALRIFDHYRFRVVNEEAKKSRDKLELQLAPSKPSEKPWWLEDWEVPVKAADRLLFA